MQLACQLKTYPLDEEVGRLRLGIVGGTELEGPKTGDAL